MAVAVVLLVVGVGCGGGSDETTSDVTKAQFVKKANLICAEFKGQRVAAAEEEFNPKEREGSHTVGSPAAKALQGELEELGEELVTNEIVPSLRHEQEKIESIGVPSGDEETLEKMLDNMEKAIDELEEKGFQGLAGDQFDAFERESETYGMACKII
jgi:hypothetical protein